MRRLLSALVAAAVVSALTACTTSPTENGSDMEAANLSHSVIPAPVSITDGVGWFVLDGAAIQPDDETAGVASYLGSALDLPLAPDGDIQLRLVDGHPDDGYSLTVSATAIVIEASDPAGLFHGAQTLRQLVTDDSVEVTTIEDSPRFAYRGAMLDVARHFFGVNDVKRYIDDIAMLKINYLHLHLSDDQGWRIQIDGWPNLTAHGSTSAVGGIGSTGSGFYTKDDYREIVAYAASRFITIVPEIDMPGHTNAALSSYPELTCDGKAPALYTGIEVGFSSFCIGRETTYRFITDVLTELAELTPGPYIHIGGDESLSTTDADFLAFANRVTEIGAATGKTLIGWHELGRSTQLPPGTVGQYWSFIEPQEGAAAEATSFVTQGGKLIMSPADVAYLDMKYDMLSPYGLEWANGYTHTADAANWDPAEVIPGIGDEQLLGVEAPIWTETLSAIDEVEYMAFPRIAEIAEIAWSPRVDAATHFDDLAPRLAAFGRVLDAAGVTYYRTPEVPWTD